MNEFKTIAAHIGDLRIQLRQTSDDSIWTDKFLYKKLLDARSVVIKQELDKHKMINDFNYLTLCLNMAPGVPVDCGCSDLQCKVLVSTQDLPQALQNKYTMFLEILDGNYNQIPQGGTTKSKYLKYYKTLKDTKSWTIINNKLVVYDADLRIKSLLVKLIPVDPVDLTSYTYSNTCGCNTVPAEPTSCFDIDTSNFPVDSWLNNTMYDLIENRVLRSGGIAEDVSNDAQSTINGK